MEPQTAIADYGIIADGRSCALVSKDGSVDWLCWPRLDSPACFAALLGTRENGRWRIAPTGTAKTSRAYERYTVILETTHETEGGAVRVLDYMAMPCGSRALVRRVEGLRGRVEMEFDLAIRADYGRTVPRVERNDEGAWHAIAGPDLFVLQSDAELHGEDLHTVGNFEVSEGEIYDFVLSHGRSFGGTPKRIGPETALDSTRAYWRPSRRLSTPANLRTASLTASKNWPTAAGAGDDPAAGDPRRAIRQRQRQHPPHPARCATGRRDPAGRRRCWRGSSGRRAFAPGAASWSTRATSTS
jgi:GH15 family glucan-1,4-alpha-glucosidase